MELQVFNETPPIIETLSFTLENWIKKICISFLEKLYFDYGAIRTIFYYSSMIWQSLANDNKLTTNIFFELVQGTAETMKFCLQISWANVNKSPSKYLPVQSQQQKHFKKLQNILRANKKDTRKRSLMSFCCLYCKLWTCFTTSLKVFLVDLEHVFVYWAAADSPT